MTRARKTGLSEDTDETAAGRSRPARQDSGGDYAAPLGSLKTGRLEFAAGASKATIRADPSMRGLYRAHFEAPVPKVHVRDGAVSIRYRSLPLFDWLFYWREPLAEVALNAQIPWEIEVRGGVSKLDADLRGVWLASLGLSSGSSEAVVKLPWPSGAVSIRLGGGASNVAVYRPAGVAARVHVGGGASNLTLDDEHFGAVGGDTRWQTPGYESAADGYEVEVYGGASNLTIDAR